MSATKTLPLALLLAACQPQGADIVQPVETDPTATELPGTETTASDEVELVSGLVIDKIAVNQAVQSILWEDGGAPTTLQPPVVAQRDALLRVFVRTQSEWDPRKVVAVLTLDTNGEQTVLESKTRIEDNSKNNDLDTTLNFDIDGELLKRATQFKVELYENKVDNPGGGDPQDVVWDSNEALGGELDIIASDKLELVIIPVRYNADGSGRMPDTSDAQLARMRDLAYGMYPANEVEVRVGPTLDWNRNIDPFNSWDWSDVLDAVGDMRASANENPNTYYYGIFEPEPTLGEFCRQGCILGLSLLSWTASDPYLRASVGIGYSGMTSVETMVHEIGHAHGREHAPCGLYGQPSDPRYPYSDAAIGDWGYDIVNGEQKGPNVTVDMMSYCNPIWVSDYTYYEILDRMLDVKAQPRSVSAELPAATLRPDGTITRRAPAPITNLSGATPVQVAVHDHDGVFVENQDAHLFPYSHFDGGLLILPDDLPLGWTAELLD